MMSVWGTIGQCLIAAAWLIGVPLAIYLDTWAAPEPTPNADGLIPVNRALMKG